MIIGIGCDLAEVSRIKRALGMKGFAARVFTQREQDYCMARGVQAYASFAARFAAKEAFVKAVGTGRGFCKSCWHGAARRAADRNRGYKRRAWQAAACFIRLF